MKSALLSGKKFAALEEDNPETGMQLDIPVFRWLRP
jgi:hypothetical protein